MTTDWPVPDGAARVLVVDDDPLFARLVAHLLEDAGYKCSTASDGEDAVSVATAEIPDLVLLDVAMPGLSGPETLTLLRADHRTALTPVVFVTGSSDSATKVRCLMSGADDYLTKPFEAAELVARVHLAIRRHRLLRDISPLTYLPGNAAIHREMARRTGSGQAFSVLWIDIDDHEQGWIETFDRSGAPHRFPLASVSVAPASSVAPAP